METYYPAPLDPPDGWTSACEGEVDATVLVENLGSGPVEVYEFLSPGCAPSERGTVGPGETVDLGVADGPVWQVYDAESRRRLGTFVLESGENTLVVP